MNATTSKWHAIETPVPDSGEACRMMVGGIPGRAPIERPLLVQKIANVLAENPLEPVWVLAPSRRIGRQWIEILARTGTPVVNLRVTTIRALAYDLASAALAKDSLRVAPKRASLVLLEKILAESESGKKLQYFRDTRSVRRLAERMLTSIVAIRQAGIDAEDISRKLKGTAKSQDLRILLMAYAAELKLLGLVDQADVMRIAIEEARACRLPVSLNRLIYPEDLDLTPRCRELLKALEQTGQCRIQKLPVDPPLNAPAASEHGTRPEISYSRAIGEVNEVRAVFRGIIERGIRFDEVELLHTDSSTYPALIQEIVALLGPAAEHENEKPRALPVTFAEGLPIRESRPARALVEWLAWRDSRYLQSGLVRLIRDNLLSRRFLVAEKADGSDGQNPDQTAAKDLAKVPQSQLLRALRGLKIGLGLENTIHRIETERKAIESRPLASFLPRGRRDEVESLELDSGTKAYAEGRKAEQLVALGLLERLTKKLKACEPPAKPTAIDIVESAQRFLLTFALHSTEFDGYARRLLLDEIEQMKQWLNEHPRAAPDEIQEWLKGLPGELVAMGSAPRAGCLHVDSVAGGGHSGRPYTFIVGLDEGRFPGGVGVDPVLPDPERKELSDDLQLSGQGAKRATDSFWRLLGRLRGQVLLGFSCRSVADQSESFPSPLMLAVYRVNSGRSEASLGDFLESLAPAESFVPRRPEHALNETEWWLATLGPLATAEDVGQALQSHRGHLRHGWRAAAARRSEEFTPFDTYVPDAGALLDPRQQNGRVASAHSLETLGACARKFFFNYGLELKPLEDLDPDAERWLDAIENGSVMHTVLERFMRGFLGSDKRPSVREHRSILMSILEEEIQKKRAEKPPTDELAYQSRRRELEQALHTFLCEEERYCIEHRARPVALEASIGMAPNGPGTPFDAQEPVTLGLPGSGTIRVGGRVDRIDLAYSPDGDPEYRIIDYKSGNASRFRKPGNKALDKGRRLQHGLYVAMVQHLIEGRESIQPYAAVTHFKYLFPGSSSAGESLEWTVEQLGQTGRMVEQLCGIVAAGAFLATTDSADCSFCDYVSICGPSATAESRKKLAAGTAPVGEGHGSLQTLYEDLATKGRASNAGTIFSNDAASFVSTQDPLPGEPDDLEARKAIRNDLHMSMLVEASAGTGKTTCMIDRMLSLVQTGQAKVQEIAAITFTRKSAAELRIRFREALEQRTRKASTDPGFSGEERGRLNEALEHGEGLVIGTIHSFCGRLLRERPIEAGIDPAAQELEPGAESILRDRAWREFCEIVPTDRELSMHLDGLENAGLELRELRAAFDTFVEHADVTSWPAEKVTPLDISDLLREVCYEIEVEYEPRFRPWHDRGTTDKMMNRLELILRRYRNRRDDSPAELMAAAEEFEGACEIALTMWWPGLSRAQQREQKDALAAWWERKVEAFRVPIQLWRAHRYQFAVPLLLAASRHYAELRLNEGKLSFADLLALSARLLGKSVEARAAFRKRYPFLLVDEFQDTDPIQAEILLLLTSRDRDESDWRKCLPVPGSLFVVGDPKQSIYRFRRADIGTYETVKQRIEASGGQVRKLTTNFRTNAELVQWVNGSFPGEFLAHRMNPDEPHGPDFTESAVGRREADTGLLSGTRLLRVSKDGTEREAQVIARFIRSAIDRGMTIPRTKGEVDRGVSSACRPEDFLIVTYNTNELSTYAQALNAEGVPVDVTGRRGADHAETLATLRMCLQMTVDPDDPVAALAVLRGPVFGFSDRELHMIKRAGYRIDGRFARTGKVEEPLDQELAERFQEVQNVLGRWRLFARRLPVAATVERIADDAGLFLVAVAAGDQAGSLGRGAGGVLASFIERVRSERSLLTSLQDVVDRIDELVKASPKQEFDTVSLDVGSGGSVRVMNLHKVKGLEAPVVFLCEEAQAKDHAPSWHVSRASGEPEGYLRISKLMSPFGSATEILAAPRNWDEWEGVEKQFLDAEKTRLQYVAATRPGTCLVVSVFVDKDGLPVGGWRTLAGYLEGVPSLPLPKLDEPSARQRDARTARFDCSAAEAAIENLHAEVSQIYQATYASVRPRDFLTEASSALKNLGRGLGQEWGTVIHRLLELAAENIDSRGKIRSLFDLKTAAHNVIQETSLDEDGDHDELVDHAVSLVHEVMGSKVWKKAQASSHAYREAPFTVQLASQDLADFVLDTGPLERPEAEQGGLGSGLPTLVHGVIDLVFEDESRRNKDGQPGWMIVDWKTSGEGASKAEVEAHYRPQLQLYARCWAAAVRSLAGAERAGN